MWPLSILSELSAWERLAGLATAAGSCLVAARRIGAGKRLWQATYRVVVAPIRLPYLEWRLTVCEEDVADLRRAIEDIRSARRGGGNGSSSGSSPAPETTPPTSSGGSRP